MPRYQTRDKTLLRQRMQESRRIVPHSVRSLAAAARVNRSIVGFLLTGERSSVDEEVGRRIAAALGRPFTELFEPEMSSSRDEAKNEGEVR